MFRCEYTGAIAQAQPVGVALRVGPLASCLPRLHLNSDASTV
jgi:hypothetical protein